MTPSSPGVNVPIFRSFLDVVAGLARGRHGGPHPEPVVTAFLLGALDDADPDSETDPMAAMTDLRAVGVATGPFSAAELAAAGADLAVETLEQLRSSNFEV